MVLGKVSEVFYKVKDQTIAFSLIRKMPVSLKRKISNREIFPKKKWDFKMKIVRINKKDGVRKKIKRNNLNP